MALRLYSSALLIQQQVRHWSGVKEADERETVLFIATFGRGSHAGFRCGVD
ncbi:hypothetical protein [Streptococcus acidominimus]|uniref:hypothetical protein n=1 Tax=Streptococcus acidominimus TaxID=1326 RepID=UPI001FD37DB6|nr:hypothetical protein [Streptococcus acidominimus]